MPQEPTDYSDAFVYKKGKRNSLQNGSISKPITDFRKPVTVTVTVVTS